MIISKIQIPNIPSRIRTFFSYTPCKKSIISEYDKFARNNFSDSQISEFMQEQLIIGAKPSLSMQKKQRMTDILVGSAAFIPCCIISGIGGLIQKIANPKFPAFYKANRVGLHGTNFVVYKLSTLRYSQDKANLLASGFSMFLRKFSIDEFPQIINVLKGDMSLFGPRVILKQDLKDAVNAVGKEFLERYNFKPGFGYGTLAEKESPIIRRNIEKASFRNFTMNEYFKTIFKLAKNVITGNNK